MISAEGPPLQRVGALVDVMNALPHELRERGHEVSVATTIALLRQRAERFVRAAGRLCCLQHVRVMLGHG